MIQYNGKTYYTPQEVKKKHGIPIPTLYNWFGTGRVEMLSLDEICEGTPFQPDDLKCKVYFEQESLMKCIKELRSGKSENKPRKISRMLRSC